MNIIFIKKPFSFLSKPSKDLTNGLLETFLFLENFQRKLISLISIKFAWHCISSTVNHLNNPLYFQLAYNPCKRLLSKLRHDAEVLNPAFFKERSILSSGCFSFRPPIFVCRFFRRRGTRILV